MTQTTRCSLLALVLLGGCFIDDSPECDLASPCPSDSICQAGVCVMMGCPPGTQTVAGACEPIPPECVLDAECPGNICDEGRCRRCRVDSECGDEVCVVGTCQAPCTETSECEAGEVCHRGVCGVTCAEDSTVCTTFLDSQLDRVSNGEQVSPRYARFGCQMSSERIVDGVCDGTLPHPGGEGGACDSCLASMGGCGIGQTCENGDCTCTANEDCPGSLVCADGYCAPCAVDEECGCDMYCSAGTCHESCETNEDCPESFVCAGGRCAGCASDSDCSPGEYCYEDGCVSPCNSTSQTCTRTGRSSVCETFEPIRELVVDACI